MPHSDHACRVCIADTALAHILSKSRSDEGQSASKRESLPLACLLLASWRSVCLPVAPLCSCRVQ